jgi:hypothetical protein
MTVGCIANLPGIYIQPAISLDQSHTVSGSDTHIVGTDVFLIRPYRIGKLLNLRFQKILCHH